MTTVLESKTAIKSLIFQKHQVFLLPDPSTEGPYRQPGLKVLSNHGNLLGLHELRTGKCNRCWFGAEIADSKRKQEDASQATSNALVERPPRNAL